MYFSIGFLIWYAFFIVLVAIEDVREKREKKKAEKLSLEESLIDKETGGERKKSDWEQD